MIIALPQNFNEQVFVEHVQTPVPVARLPSLPLRARPLDFAPLPIAPQLFVLRPNRRPRAQRRQLLQNIPHQLHAQRGREHAPLRHRERVLDHRHRAPHRRERALERFSTRFPRRALHPSRRRRRRAPVTISHEQRAQLCERLHALARRHRRRDRGEHARIDHLRPFVAVRGRHRAARRDRVSSLCGASVPSRVRHATLRRRRRRAERHGDETDGAHEGSDGARRGRGRRPRRRSHGEGART
mmetsp:Transcript_6999/g.28261  ORF Transcript_6999/g.28261 Transcript_6999/m.28261 type:complete len:242 (+) Transcript_6999:1920-2645(+)